MKKQEQQFWPLIALAVMWFLIGWFGRSFSLNKEIWFVETVRQDILKQYPGEVPSSRELTYGAIQGMLARTGDPYAALLTAEAAQRYGDDFAGNSGVIGLFPEFIEGKLVVTAVSPGESAAAAGMQVGDQILSIDETIIDTDVSLAEIALLIRGSVGTPVEFVVQRDGQLFTFRPVREERTVVTSKMLDDGIGYIQQYAFTINAADKMKEALQQIMSANPRAIIWDLRSNGGGSMEVAQAILSQFIASGDLFYVEQKGGEREVFTVQEGGTVTAVPLIILVGEHTYSAAETAALTVQEANRGIIIGETTYGKGTVQTTIPIAEDMLVQMTIGYWFSPQGQSINEHGVVPDIVVADDPTTEVDEVLQAAVMTINESSIP